MIKWFVDRPVATSMIFIGLLVLGVFSFMNTPLELAPKEEFPEVSVRTSWPGVTPEIVQTRVTAPLEEKLATVKGVRKVSSSSRIGASQITLELDPDVNMEFATLAIREEISKTRDALPYGLRPEVVPFVPEDFRVRPFLGYTISGNYPVQKLRELVKTKLELGLGSIMGISKVEVSGGSDPEIRVILDKSKLEAYGIEPSRVGQALGNRTRVYPAGRVMSGNQEYLFKVTDALTGLKEIGETIVGRTGANPVALKDVAEIAPAYTDVDSSHRINGRPTISLTLTKEKGANTLKVSREVKRKIGEIRKDLPADLILKTLYDESADIHKNVNELYRLAGIIVILVFGMIFIILRRFLPSLLILSSIAFSTVITFNLIYAFGISMNMLTLGALALGFGMFVDDSIVVFENTLRLREQGVPAKEASVRGPREVGVAVLASTLTTISVFACFPYFQGRLKIYYLPLAVVISSALAASLLVSFTLIPALSPRVLGIRQAKTGTPRSGRIFSGILRFILRHPLAVILLAAGALFGSYRWFRSEVSLGEFFSWYNKERLDVMINMPPGSDMARTDAVLKKFEDIVLETSYEKEMNAVIGPEEAYITITFPPDIENSARPYILKEEITRLATQFAGLSISVFGFDPQGYYSSMEAGTYYDSRIKLFGYNLKKLMDITGDLENTLRRNPRIKEVRAVSDREGWWRPDAYEYVLKIDPERLRRYDMEPRDFYFSVQTLLAGRFGVPTRALIDGREMDISLKFPEFDILDLNHLRDTMMRSRAGESLRLGEVSTVEERIVAGGIDRENQQFQRTLMWEFRGPYKAAENYKKSVFASLKLPPGFSATLEDDRWMTREEKSQIKLAVAAALIIIFMILAALYESFIQPFIILLSVPLALIGVFAAFVVSGYSFDSSAYIGVILMAGIVVKNAILVVDHINLKRRRGIELCEAVVQGTRDRIRPILMTTGTTVFGLLPMLLIRTEGGRRGIWSSLALCTAGGLVSSTIFILMIIPVFYYISERIRPWFVRKAAEAHESIGGGKP
jgi:hydrophobic/amphiphilic exporter-1 (mainly G- bacteria), HAE1 family